MAIFACLGWGSLIWSPADLPLRSHWYEDGPLVQVELARQSNDGRITFVLDSGTPPVRSLWAIMDLGDLAVAQHALGIREGISEKNHDALIGSWQIGELQSPECVLDVSDWARRKAIEGVVWTALPPRFEKEKRKPSPDEVVDYLKGLSGGKRNRAEEYVRKAPRQIATPYRHQIEATLGWTAI